MPISHALLVSALTLSAVPPAPHIPRPQPYATAEVVPGVSLERVVLGAPSARLRAMGMRPGPTPGTLRMGAITALLDEDADTVREAWVDVFGGAAPAPFVSYQGRALDLRRDPAAVALDFGDCGPVESLPAGARVRCRGGRVSVEWSQCPAGYAGPCHALRIRVSKGTPGAAERPRCTAYVRGDHLVRAAGGAHLACRPRVRPGEVLCLGGRALSAGASLAEARALWSGECRPEERRGGSWLRCPALGVALAFQGPRGALTSLALDGPGRALDAPASFEARALVPATSPGATVRWGAHGEPYVTAARPALTSAGLASVAPEPSAPAAPAGTPRLSLALTPRGAAALRALAGGPAGARVALLVDGCVQAALPVRQALDGDSLRLDLACPTGAAQVEALRARLAAGLPGADGPPTAR